MRKNRIVKMVMSAAAAAYVVVMPVQAEENGEEIIIRECGDAYAGPKPDGCGQMMDENTWNANGTDENAEYDGIEYENEEAEYSAMGEAAGGGEISLEDAQMEELIRKNGYGPHLLLLKKQEEEKEEAVPESAAAPYSEEDLYVLAHAICGEGQGYPDDEQLYIGSVILNRRANGAFPDTIKGVVFQRGQYACTKDGNYYREPTEANWRNARWLLENGSILPGNVVYQARFRQGSGLYVQTRYHKYCYR